MSGTEDRELARLIAASPQEGLVCAIDRYAGAVETVCRAILGAYGQEDVEEAVSDAFAALWRQAGEFDEKKGTLKSYICGIARNCALSRARSLRRRQAEYATDEIPETPIGDSAEDAVLCALQTQIVRDAIGRLKPPADRVFTERYINGLAVADVAKKLELPQKKVENLLSRGKKRLEKILRDGGIAYA